MGKTNTENTGLKGRKVMLHDMCLRDGMHALREQISVEQMVKVATALDDAGVPMLQVTHGAGLGGNSLQHGFALASNEDYLTAVIPKMKQAKVSVLLIPGLGTMKELQSAYECGVHSVHVATHCTEADTSPQHIEYARNLGLDTTGFLMMAHLNDAKGLSEQAKLMESYGAQTVFITDSAGYMLPSDVKDRVSAYSIAAIEAGASRIDASVAGLGAGAGNTPLEVLAAVCERMGIETGIDLFKVMDVAEDIIVPMMDHLVRVDRESLILGYAGVYSTFVLNAKRAAERFGVPARDILVELGRRKMIGGQEDMIEDTAMSMAKERGLLADVVRAAS